MSVFQGKVLKVGTVIKISTKLKDLMLNHSTYFSLSTIGTNGANLVADIRKTVWTYCDLKKNFSEIVSRSSGLWSF